jgi:hypothetical protein
MNGPPHQNQPPQDPSSTPAAASTERIFDLLADRATQGIPEDQMRELDRLQSQCAPIDGDALDLAAAAVDVALIGTVAEPMPDALQQRIEAAAIKLLSGHSLAAPGRRSAPALATSNGEGGRRDRRDRVSNGLAWAGWIATAAMFALAVTGWWPRLTASGQSGRIPLLAMVQEFERTAPGLLRASWQPQADPAVEKGAAGEVLWSEQRQGGYLRIKGLRSNDPNRFQYQLWIFSKEPLEPYPVSGGVFDVDPASGEAIVPIECKVKVQRATAFAVTVEEPGGVWVSERKRVALMARVGGAGPVK